MFVRCSNCQTQFSLDDRQVGADGVAVRCAVCRYVFRVDGQTDSALWRIRTVDGDLFEAEDLPTLRVWVSEGRLHPDDTISRTGKHWIRLGDMPEFSDAFAGFPGLPSVLSAPGGGPLEDDLGAVGPPPSYGGDDVPTEVADAVRPTSRVQSERLDMSGLFDLPESSDDLPAVPDDLSERPAPSPSEDTVTVAPGAVSRTSLYEDSASMVLDDLVAPKPKPEPEPDAITEVAPVSEISGPRRKPKHRTKKVQTLAPGDDSRVVRVIDPEELEPEPEPDAAQPRVAPSGPSMLGAVTAHVKNEPVRPIAGTQPPPEEAEAEPEPAGVALESVEPRGSKRASWPLFAGLGILCGAAVVFGIPQIRTQVLGTGSTPSQVAAAKPAALAEVDAAVAQGRLSTLESASSAAASASQDPALPVEVQADLALAAAEARAAASISLRLQALHDGEGDAGYRADDAAEAAAQGFAGVDVERATPRRLARTRARVRLAQGRPQDEVLPLVPADEPELRALVLGAQLFSDPEARVPSGLISTLAGLENPSIPARVLLATAYARGGDEVGARAVHDALRVEAADDPTVRALLSEGTVAVADPDETAGADDEGGDGDDEETLEVEDDEPTSKPAANGSSKEQSKGGMSIDKLISVGCEKVEGGDVSSGLKLLLKAFDRRPNDLDVLVCLGTANRKKGTPGSALRYYERALKRSPKFMPALLGAARTATKLGSDDKALTYYRRVLAVSPSNAEAKSYVAKKNAPTKKPTPPSGVDERKPEPPGTPGARKPEPPQPESP